MNTLVRTLRGLEILMILAMFAVGLYAYPWLPDQIPSHWGVSGQVDDTMRKDIGIWLLPVITLMLALVLPFIRYIDPRKQNYKKFEVPFLIFQLTLVAYFAYIFGIQLYASLHPEFAGSAATLIIAGVGVLFFIIGACMPKIRWNFFVGIRTPWTLSNERVWNRTHKMAGKLWMATGVLTLLATLSGVVDPLMVFIPAVVIAAFVPIIYSFVIFSKMKKK